MLPFIEMLECEEKLKSLESCTFLFGAVLGIILFESELV